MNKIEKFYVRELRADLEEARQSEVWRGTSPAHRATLNIEKLERRYEQGDNFRWALAVVFSAISVLVTGPFWLEIALICVAAVAWTCWLVMAFTSWREAQARVLAILEDHSYAQTEAAAERY